MGLGSRCTKAFDVDGSGSVSHNFGAPLGSSGARYRTVHVIGGLRINCACCHASLHHSQFTMCRELHAQMWYALPRLERRLRLRMGENVGVGTP